MPSKAPFRKCAAAIGPSEVFAMQYILLAIAFLAIAVYLSRREAKEEARRHEYDRLRNTRPPDEN